MDEIDERGKFFWEKMDDHLMSWLVVSANPSEKYEFVNWDDERPNWMET